MGLRIAIFGQAPFGRDVTLRLADAGHEIVGVYVPPDRGRPDPLAAEAEERGWRLLRHKSFRRQGQARPERVAEYLELGAELNVLPFTTVILPPEIVDAPVHKSLCFHPSLLPAFRGGNAIPWTVMLGAQETGVTVFQPDEGVDTGPIVVQRGGIPIAPTDTAASLYFDKIYPAGVEAMVEAVEAVAAGTATFTPQTEAGASFQGLVTEEDARIDWSRPAAELDRQVRGCDPQPGAWCVLEGTPVRLYGASLAAGDGAAEPGRVLGLSDAGLRIGLAGGELRVAKLRVGDGKKLPAAEVEIASGARFG
ncbi:MAG: methionyl-tRNA formyltransferase [Proteobacteria bacterium]|nr:methionyl-tRNA formyltransferase [Pseudomonadota bacterium]